MKITRREFLSLSAAAACTLVISTGLSGCGGGGAPAQADPQPQPLPEPASAAAFNHGLASGDPQSDKIIIWTRVTPENGTSTVTVRYEVAEDAGFGTLIHDGEVMTDASVDFTVKVDIQNLSPSSEYYYRFITGETVSPVGKMKTLPVGSLSQLKMAVFSCANYPKGFFNVYADAATHDDLDVVLHLGDYIYEYGMFETDGVTPAYATENAAKIGRELPADNATELLTLEDYRKRYALYHTDRGLQQLHAAVPFIVVWDDHEVANDAYKDGAQNHNPVTEGSFSYRRSSALRAYFEWLPIRPAAQADVTSPFPEEASDTPMKIYRSFDFGDLVSLHMLDTRIIGRDKQLSYADYMTVNAQGNAELDAAAFQAALTNPSRTIMGSEQLQWLQQSMTMSTATWQVLGQQVLMGRMNIPAELLTLLAALDGNIDASEKAALLQQLQTAFGELATIKTRMLQNDPTLSAEEMARASTTAPYNLDAWDGYFMERETVLGTALAADKNLVVLAGDTHNAWASNLKALNPGTMMPEYQAGVEFAVTSVTSPGLEEYIGLSTAEAAMQFEQVLQLLIDDLQYANLNNRGYMIVTFTPEKAEAEWFFMDNIDSESYGVLASRSRKLAVAPGKENRRLIET